MSLVKLLANLGYGSRREVERLFDARRVRRDDGSALRATDLCPPDRIRVDGEPLDPPAGSVIALHKPVGFVTSTADRNPLVYDLLPPRFRLRSPLMAPVGRLDRDTSGLLLLTDDGALNHRVTSPRSHLPKRYRATLAEPLRGEEAATFASGALRLAGEAEPLAPATLEVLGDREAVLTLVEGRYHQVRRMFAAVGNHVVTLARESIGPIGLGDLVPGAWRVLAADELAALDSALRAARATGSS
jgi:16S rRNA pseudouridine516 synthase